MACILLSKEVSSTLLNEKYMKKLLASVILLGASIAAQASPINVSFAFTNVATGSFTYDSSLDGTLIDYSDLSAFNLTFHGATTSSYDLAFINSGNFAAWHYLNFNSATDSFLMNNIAGYPTTMAAIKNNFGQGFFVRDDGKYIVDYAGGGTQSYQALQISVDRATPPNDVPLPATPLLTAIGLAALALARRRKA